MMSLSCCCLRKLVCIEKSELFKQQQQAQFNCQRYERPAVHFVGENRSVAYCHGSVVVIDFMRIEEIIVGKVKM